MPGKGQVGNRWAVTETDLNCGHTILLNPYPRHGDTVYCRRCTEYTDVNLTNGWKTKCLDCPVARVYGADFTGAGSQARRHVQIYGHTVLIIQGTVPRRRVVAAGVANTPDRYRIVTLDLGTE